MKPLGLSQQDERDLAGDKPVLTGVDSAGLRQMKRLDEATAFAKRVDDNLQRRFGKERASVRFWVDRAMEDILQDVDGLLEPSVVEPPVVTRTNFSSFQEAANKTKLHKQDKVTANSLLPLPTGINGKLSSEDHRSARRGRKRYQMVGNDEKASLQSPKTTRDLACSVPYGFPRSFEESGFECLTHWADVSFQEALLTALGPRSERERRRKDEHNNCFLVSVACYLLNEVLTRDTRLSSLWLQIRDVIFRAIFAPSATPEAQKTGAEERSTVFSFETPQDYKNVRLWSDKLLETLKEKTHLSERIVELQNVVRKKRLILRFAQRCVDKMCIKYVFFAWRRTTQQRRAFCDAAMKYVTRVRQRMHVEGCFLRWRRVAACSHVSELTRALRESEIRLAMLEKSSSKTVAAVTKELEEEQKSVRFLKLGQEALKSQLAESHVLALRAINNEIRQYQSNVIAAKKDAKRWERLAKTFTFKSACPMVPSFLKKSGLALRQIEEKLAEAVFVPRDLLLNARSCLEAFLLDWVNFLMKNSVAGIFWCRVVKISTSLNDGDFGATGLLRFVRVLKSFYVKKGAQNKATTSYSCLNSEFCSSAVGSDKSLVSSSNKLFDTLFGELKNLLYLQTMEGLFPPLLSHCQFAESFFTPESFCRITNATAILWVLASLFVGYTRLICGGPVVVKSDIDPTFCCRQDEVVCGNTFGLVQQKPALNQKGQDEEKTGGAFASSSPLKKQKMLTDIQSRIVTKDTVIKKKVRSSVWRKKLFLQIAENDDKAKEEKASISTDAERLADTISDLEAFLGIDKNYDEYSSSSSNYGSSNDDCFDINGFFDGKSALCSDGSIAESEFEKQVEEADSTDVSRLKRVRRKARIIPPVDDSLCSLSMQEFVQFNHQELNRRRTWLGLSRVVTSLLVRFRILDGEFPIVPSTKISGTSRRKKKRILNSATQFSLPLNNNSRVTKHEDKTVRLLPSYNVKKDVLTLDTTSIAKPVTLRSILSEAN